MQLTKSRIIIFGVVTIVLAGAAIWLEVFHKFVRVPTGAMAASILPGDCLLVDRFFGEIKRGDIILFKYPADPSIQYVSRVIGLPGETIEIRDTKVLINQTDLSEPCVIVLGDPASPGMRELSSEGEGPYRTFYYSEEHQGGPGRVSFGPRIQLLGRDKQFSIPDGHYFVLGDNRDNSQDSRYFGPVARDLITGKPYLIYWSSEKGEGPGSGEVRWSRVFSKLK